MASTDSMHIRLATAVEKTLLLGELSNKLLRQADCLRASACQLCVDAERLCARSKRLTGRDKIIPPDFGRA
jgi:hypothetical protein